MFLTIKTTFIPITEPSSILPQLYILPYIIPYFQHSPEKLQPPPLHPEDISSLT